MKKFLLVLLTLISINTFAQINVKEGSFRKIDGYLMLDKEDHRDDNWKPMALIKITAEGMKAEERAKLRFKGNLSTYIDVNLNEEGETYLYLTAQAATFLEIIHPDYGKTEYHFPFDLCDFCGYEMVVQYVPLVPIVTQEPSKPKKTYLIVKSDQTDARIYIDDELVNTHEASKTVDIGSTHTYKIECNLYHTESGSVTVNNKTEIDKKLRPAFGYINISTIPEQGAKAFVDGDYVGLTPIKTDKLKSGSHTVMVMKDMYKMKEQSYNVTDGQTTNATLNMDANFVTVTLTVGIGADIYVDEEYKGKEKWSGRLSDGAHIFEARKENHKKSVKTVNLVLGKNEAIALDAPTPINGEIDINTTPMGASIYIDGKHYGETPNYISDILIGSHELKLTKQGCSEIKKAITIKEGEALSVNEKLQTGKEISISTDKSGDKIYVDGNYLGISPIATYLPYGNYEVKAERSGKTVSKTINVAQSGGDDSVKLTFFANQTITVNGISFTMIAVEGGTFLMGAVRELDSDADGDESPVHNVTLSDYYIGETEVTQDLWETVMKDRPSSFFGNKRPVDGVSWEDCQEFITRLNQLTGMNFRLPTEAEWEYAARGGNKSQGYKYSGSNTIKDVALFCHISSSTHDVKTKQANELGIYDMSGNVSEWCQDWYGNYSGSSQTNPTGPTSGSRRVFRGGHLKSDARHCRVSSRYSFYPELNYLGLRLVIGKDESDGAVDKSVGESNVELKFGEQQTGKEITITTDMILNNGEVSVQSLGESAPTRLKVVSASCSNNLAPQGNNTYGPWNMLDGNPATVWAVNLNDPSIRNYDGDRDCIYGPWFDVKCKKLSHIVIRNGYGKSTSSFINNSRASRVAFEIEVNGDLEWFEFPLRDDPSPQHLNVPLNIEGNSNIISIQLVLDSRGGGIIKGEKWNDLCISEIEFWGWE